MEYTKEQFEADLKARQEKEAAEEQAKNERVEKETARRLWLKDGGNERDFEASWPQLRDERRRQRVLSADERARTEMRQSAGSRI